MPGLAQTPLKQQIVILRKDLIYRNELLHVAWKL